LSSPQQAEDKSKAKQTSKTEKLQQELQLLQPPSWPTAAANLPINHHLLTPTEATATATPAATTSNNKQQKHKQHQAHKEHTKTQRKTVKCRP